MEDDFDEGKLFSIEASKPVPNVQRLAAQIPVGNPLTQYFRQPGLSVKIPTNGAFFPEGGIELDHAGELTVYPMSGSDEILLASPDALMNSTAISRLIQSCVPAIKMPGNISAPDLDVLLLAIRVASTGENMDVDIKCEKCGTDASYEVHLPTLLTTMTSIEPINTVRLNSDLIAYIEPHTFDSQTKVLMAAFKEHRIAQGIDENPDLTDEDRAIEIGKAMERLSNINNEGLANAIRKIVTPQNEVSDKKFILEFLQNTDAKTLNKLRTEVERINTMGLDKKIPVQCAKCSHEWDAMIEFNPANFFDKSSLD